MSLDATRVALKAKLADNRADKGRLRPHEMIRKKMPDGTGSLQDLPARAKGTTADDEAADGAYCKAIDRVTAAFGKQSRAQTTADEHRIPSFLDTLLCTVATVRYCTVGFLNFTTLSVVRFMTLL